MITIDGNLYLGWDELVTAGISKHTINRASSQGYNTWAFIKSPSDARRSLAQYEILADKYKDKIVECFGDPYDYVAKQPIKALVKQDYKAEQFYLDYTYGDGKVLKQEQVNKYTTVANWLNMITECLSDKRQLKKTMNLTIDKFYIHIYELIEIHKVSLPTSYKRLNIRIKKYKDEGYQSIIPAAIGNSSSAKIVDNLSESLLLELLSNANQFDDVLICNKYNLWAKEKGYKPITSKTVGNHRRLNKDLLTLQREGTAAFKDARSMKLRGFRPSKPLYLVENDDNVLDLYFQDIEGNHYKKYTAMVVIDSHNDYVLGYAYALNINADLVRAAYMNALYYIRSVTGGWHLPHETKSDRWATANLKPFYAELGERIEARLGNKNRGYIEPFFGTNLWKNSLKMGANNYSGNNITALNRGVNAEYLADNKKDVPFVGEQATKQIEAHFHNLRHQTQANGLSKHEEWVAAWDKMDDKDKRPISQEQYLSKFGVEHNHRGKGVRITTHGIDFTRNGKDYSYQLNPYRPDLIGVSVSVRFDPRDLSTIYVTDGDRVRLLAKSTKFLPRALADHDVDSKDYLMALLQSQTDHFKKTKLKKQQIEETLYENRVNAQAILQAGVLEKSQRRIAEQTMHELPEAVVIESSNKKNNPLDKL